jgi:hypothetical protein
MTGHVGFRSWPTAMLRGAPATLTDRETAYFGRRNPISRKRPFRWVRKGGKCYI